jgi:hypothetical protein
MDLKAYSHYLVRKLFLDKKCREKQGNKMNLQITWRQDKPGEKGG